MGLSYRPPTDVMAYRLIRTTTKGILNPELSIGTVKLKSIRYHFDFLQYIMKRELGRLDSHRSSDGGRKQERISRCAIGCIMGEKADRNTAALTVLLDGRYQ